MDTSNESSIHSSQEVNQGSYLTLHNAQIFNEGKSFSGNERNKTWINLGDGFADVSEMSGADIPNDSRAVVGADFDDDGDVDLFVHSIQRERHSLFRNDAQVPGKDAGFIKVRLRATSGQYEAIGASVIVHGPKGPNSQVLSRGAGFVSCQVPELVFGLGAAESARVEVRWPGGALESFGVQPAGSRLLLVEGSAKPEPIAAIMASLPDPLPPGLRLNEGDMLPALTVLDADGTPVALNVAALAGGKPVMLNLWASYCSPCIGEMGFLEERHQSGEVFVIALSTDVPDDQARARAILKAKGVSFPTYYLAPAESSLPDTMGVEDLIDLKRLNLPTTLALSSAGALETILTGRLRAPGEE